MARSNDPPSKLHEHYSQLEEHYSFSEETRVRIEKAIAKRPPEGEIGQQEIEERAAAMAMKAKKKPKKAKPPEEVFDVCPMCECEATIIKTTRYDNLDVKGMLIRVKQTFSHCTECDEEFVNSNDEDDYLEEAYSIYMKRKDPANRKFKKINFRRGEAWVGICQSCANTYDLGLRPIPLSSRLRGMGCGVKGCDKRADQKFSLGKL